MSDPKHNKPDESLSVAKHFKKTRAPRGAKKVSLSRLKKQLMTCLERDTLHLMDSSFAGKLSEEESSDLRGYLKLVKELMKDEAKENELVSDADLEKIAEKDLA